MDLTMIVLFLLSVSLDNTSRRRVVGLELR
jgi:hypothetical protein